jgi:hypothetical protein
VGRSAPNIRDVKGLNAALSDMESEMDAMAQEDVVIDNARRLMLRSPNGTYWAITVSDAGALSTVNMGASL